MSRSPQLVLLIVPCYNEAQRIDKDSYKELPEGLHILFANDGSTDSTLEHLESIRKTNARISVYNSSQNVGKAQIIFKAFQHAHEVGMTDQFEWIGFWDADLATPFFEVANMISYESLYQKRFDAIWCSRVYRLGAHIERSSLRHYLGRIFATVTSVLLDLKAYDTQCGAKIFRRDCAKNVFSQTFLSKWIFDIEIYLRAQKSGFEILEYPVHQWKDIPGSKLKVWREIFRVCLDILMIKKAYSK